MRTYRIENVLEKFVDQELAPLYQPDYTGKSGGRKIMLAVEDMKRHMTDEGWQIAQALEHNDYTLCGFNLPPYADCHVPVILSQTTPDVVVLQDKREWDAPPGNFREQRARFHNTEHLATRSDVFKLTILKDSHQRPAYHAQAAQEIGCHAWITYYHSDIVSRLAPYVRPQHLVRTYHSLDKDIVPEFNTDERFQCLLSGAVSRAYPLRTKIRENALMRNNSNLIDILKHPGYHRDGSNTPSFLETLSHYKVAVCTSSMYGYALRKIIEATACGCIVLTDLPEDEVMPAIDGNLVRIHPQTSFSVVQQTIENLCNGYDLDRQRHFANIAKEHYDYRHLGKLLANDIETLRSDYNVF